MSFRTLNKSPLYCNDLIGKGSPKTTGARLPALKRRVLTRLWINTALPQATLLSPDVSKLLKDLPPFSPIGLASACFRYG